MYQNISLWYVLHDRRTQKLRTGRCAVASVPSAMASMFRVNMVSCVAMSWFYLHCVFAILSRCNREAGEEHKAQIVQCVPSYIEKSV